jgi:uncharacterized membrane protein
MDKFLSAFGGRIGGFVGALLGLGVGLLLVALGFWRGLLVIIFVVVGYLIGSSLDGDNTIQEILRRLFPMF